MSKKNQLTLIRLGFGRASSCMALASVEASYSFLLHPKATSALFRDIIVRGVLEECVCVCILFLHEICKDSFYIAEYPEI